MASACQLLQAIIIRLYRSTTYVDVAYCYRPSSVVCRSVSRSVSHEPWWTDWDTIWVVDSGGPRKSLLDQISP